jgi:hypothetical protein
MTHSRWWFAAFVAWVLLAGAHSLTAAERESPNATSDKAHAKSITFDNLKLEMAKEDPYDAKLLTGEVKKLDGQAVRLKGFILPGFQNSGIKQFVLMRDNMECCFGPGAAIYDSVIVDLKDGPGIEFTPHVITVEGTFVLREQKGPDEKPLSIYHLDAKRVK